MGQDQPKSTEAEKFESELDEFFKDRAEFRASQFSDKTKSQAATERTEGEELEDASKGSGCCMTGCHDCPWQYAG
ncbi:MAG: hypothetical protein HOA17_01460 [Candidatus Melainabacteria bacterium]|jgi:hypothetical protein|nr:hypothetical protein [Candidatus Melainabacteria bacterium]